ncbi:tetratricopeptide repeat protein [Sinimarinibacterium sp. CAU 1509]|uniref:tetratricopeptide repeat protein n=1 Tax=Sinimarinibacterium sp. CAU 1509 TaxID=2562283 RepID=UPI0010AD6A8B|nr:tetratricopeptide repeat protein [Sinimarinibacterium sp. CAU 1509]TJY58788.1 tetratricopeptide repeat protein [Sinimarinibacterium sp. CAU 1509]
MYPFYRAVAVAAALALAPAAFAADDNTLAKAQTLMSQGKADDALKLLDAHVKKNPQDAEARFTRGLALARLNRNKEAIQVFADLTRDYPQLPEPFNNLAVLYAAQGDYEKARDALEAALATHPTYATAHENLGDIYAALAGAAYNRALQLDAANQGLRRKLALINDLDSTTVAVPPAPAAVAIAPTPVPSAAPQTPAAEAVMPAPAVAVAETPVPAAVEPAVETPAAAAAPVEAAAPTAPALSDADKAGLQSAVEAWAAAWSSQDLNAYFAAYDADFTPEGGLSRSAWETQRRARISAPKKISVKVAETSFSAGADDRASVSFRQNYTSDNFKDSVVKVLDFKRNGSSWTILREYSR